MRPSWCCWSLAAFAWVTACKKQEDVPARVVPAPPPARIATEKVSAPAAEGGQVVGACIPGFRAHVLVSALGFSGDGRSFAFFSEGHYFASSYSDAVVGVVVDARTGAARCFFVAPGDLDPDEATGRLGRLPGKGAFEAWRKGAALVYGEPSMIGPDQSRVEIDADPRFVRGTLGDDGYDYVCRGLGTKPDDEIEESPEAPACGATLALVVRKAGRVLGRTAARPAGNLGDVAAHWTADGRRVAFVHNAEDRSTVDGAFVAVTVLALGRAARR